MQAGDAIGGEVDRVAAVLQVVTDVGGDVLVVFDHEDAHAWVLWMGLYWTAAQPTRSDAADSCTGRRMPGATTAARAEKGPGKPPGPKCIAPMTAIHD
ncbi:hypothetical protein GCM10011394_22440 [Luteimonas terricola]|uniref:Uncharacterized protein n=1 Tax=Luteimonas terricola TaxID=645597 RepID=A0ABQ2EKF9_9GAMM|nr:hypothetical protein GCM10011394_22440 [Luteimonas terricola]